MGFSHSFELSSLFHIYRETEGRLDKGSNLGHLIKGWSFETVKRLDYFSYIKSSLFRLSSLLMA